MNHIQQIAWWDVEVPDNAVAIEFDCPHSKKLIIKIETLLKLVRQVDPNANREDIPFFIGNCIPITWVNASRRYELDKANFLAILRERDENDREIGMEIEREERLENDIDRAMDVLILDSSLDESIAQGFILEDERGLTMTSAGWGKARELGWSPENPNDYIDPDTDEVLDYD